MSEECDSCHILKERVDQLAQRIYEKFESEKELRDKLETMMNVRLESMNEFRHQLDKQSALFVTWWNLGIVVCAMLTLSVAISTFIARFIWH